jgi:hypothetical protein
MIECEWQAWYDRLPGGDNRLHVAGTCEVESSSVDLRLEPEEGTGGGGEPDTLALKLISSPPEAGRRSVIDEQVSWTGEPVQPGERFKRVRIGGETDVTLEVMDES